MNRIRISPPKLRTLIGLSLLTTLFLALLSGPMILAKSATNVSLQVSADDFINDTDLYENGVQAFQEYNPLRDEFYGTVLSDDGRMENERKLYRAYTYGSDAAVSILDGRSFRDAPIEPITVYTDQTDISRFLSESFDPSRTLLGSEQVADLKNDLLAAQSSGVTWKFVMVPEPIQNLGIVLAEDRFEGYAAERTDLLKFIADNSIPNVVFVAADIHGTVVNNLSYQESVSSPLQTTGAFEVTTGPVAFDDPFGPTSVELALQLGLINENTKDLYDALPIMNDPGDAGVFPNDKDDFVKRTINLQLQQLGYDSVGLEGSDIDANLIQGDYLAAHTFGWTEFEIGPTTQLLTVTTYGTDVYSPQEVSSSIINQPIIIVSQFIVTPTQIVSVSNVVTNAVKLISPQLSFSAPITLPTTFPNGVAAGDVSQTSAVLWARSTATGSLTLTYAATPSFTMAITRSVIVTNALLPVKTIITGLTTNTTYYYSVTNVVSDTVGGYFTTAAPVGTRTGLRFGVSGDWRGELSPYPAIQNVPKRDLNFFVELGDTIYADYESPILPGVRQTETITQYRLKHSEVYSTRLGLNVWADIRGRTAILAMMGDHEVINYFAGGAKVSTDPRFFDNDVYLPAIQKTE